MSDETMEERINTKLAQMAQALDGLSREWAGVKASRCEATADMGSLAGYIRCQLPMGHLGPHKIYSPKPPDVGGKVLASWETQDN